MTELHTNNDPTIDIPRFLGWAGLIPFALAALSVHSGTDALILYGFVGGTAYAAIILSFLGAVHWGLSMVDKRHPYWYIWSVTPALLGCTSLMAFDVQIRLFALIPLFALAWSVDKQAAQRGLLPDWYMTLRTQLTLGAILSLSAMFFA
ncbi:MAG: DUF3429 domain-containing protein [Candidatus Puniceispirillum sp.]